MENSKKTSRLFALCALFMVAVGVLAGANCSAAWDWTNKQAGNNRYWFGAAISGDGKYQIYSGSNDLTYFSSDYGANFAELKVGGYSAVSRAIDISSTGQYMIVANFNGKVFISSDYGANWTEKQPDGNNWRYWYSAAISGDGKYLAVSNDYAKIWVSSDYGANWSEKNAGNNMWCYHLDISATGEHILCSTPSSRIWWSKNYGANWEYITAHSTGTSVNNDGSYFWGIKPSPYKTQFSTDYGATWTETNNSANAIDNSLTGKYVISGGYPGRIYISSDYGATWTEEQPAGNADKSWEDVVISENGKYVLALDRGGGVWLGYNPDNYDSAIPPHELAITYPEDEASLDDQLNHFSVEYFTPDCGDFHLQIAIGTDEQAVENATSSSSGIEYIDTLFALPEWCAANGKIDVGNYVILDEDTTYYAKPMLYRWEGWAQRYNTKLAEGSVISFAIGEYFGLATANAASSFYTSHLPAFFGEAQPSAIYSTLVKVFNAVFNPLLKFLSDITIYFSTATAIENGANAGYPIAVFLAYAALINDFAGIPLVEIITTMLILQLAIVVINLALKGKKTVA